MVYASENKSLLIFFQVNGTTWNAFSPVRTQYVLHIPIRLITSNTPWYFLDFA